MKKKLLLYIDILGFSQMVGENTDIVDDLYNVIASLNVHRHNAFKSIIFSDTILVYNIDDPIRVHDWEYLVMYLCEFVQDLQHRLSGRNIFFRALITYGDFVYYEINKVPCYYGKALIDAYTAEKEIKCPGLFISKECNEFNKIFKTKKYNESLRFVYLTQTLEQLEYLYGGCYPMEGWLLRETDLCWHIAPEIQTIKEIYSGMKGHPDKEVREKYKNAFNFYRSHYPKTIGLMEESGFDLRKISDDMDWTDVLNRIPEDFSWVKNES